MCWFLAAVLEVTRTRVMSGVVVARVVETGFSLILK